MAFGNDLPEPITSIPQEDVGNVVQRSIDYDGVVQLEVKQQPDGTFTVTPKKLAN